MRNPSLSLKLAFTFSFVFSYSLTLSSSFSSSLPSLPKLSFPFSLKSSSSSSASPSSPSPSQELAADLLALLGSKRDAARIPAGEAREFRSCLRFLVPFSPPPEPSRIRQIPSRRDLPSGCVGGTTEADEMVWWPPAPVMELARLSVDSGGDPGAIHRTLDPTVLPVPDVEELKKDKCQLTRTPYGWRFVDEELNSYFAFLFELIVARAPSVGLNVSLSRYDLFHGHLFIATESGRLGIL